MRFPILLAQVQRPSPSPTPTGVMKYIDQANNALTNANFEEAMRNPWFLIFSAVVILGALARGAKGLLVTYIVGILFWGIIHYTVLKDRASAGEGTQSIYVFAGLVVVVAGVGIYFLLIRD